MRTRITSFLLAILLLVSLAAIAADPGKHDFVLMDSIRVKPGDSGIMTIRVQSDDTTTYNGKNWVGVGSFCLPIKYNRSVIKLDSVKFTGSVKEWDEKFTNPKIDTGFVSFVGIYNIGAKDNPPLFSPKIPQEIIKIFFGVNKDAKPGKYLFELTIDPIQKEAYFGSVDGFNSWKPEFVPGIVIVRK
jgi:hypothetical protein